MTAHDDPTSILVLVEGGQLLLYDLTSSMGQQTPSGSPPVPELQPPPVQQLFKEQLQGQPLVTATRLAMIPTHPLPLRGLQVRCC